MCKMHKTVSKPTHKKTNEMFEFEKQEKNCRKSAK